MDLPHELIDEIISHIPRYDKKSLQNCSLVAKSWMHPSRRRLFEKVMIPGEAYLKLLQDAISPTEVGVFQHVRSLTCNIHDEHHLPQGFDDFLRDYSPSFCQLERLSIFTLGSLALFTQIWTTSAFQHTLSYLRLENCSAAASALVTLVSYFPNLAHLDLVRLSHEADDQPVLPFSRPLRKLSLTEFSNNSMGLLDQLMGLRPQCDEVTVRIDLVSSPSLAQRVIDGTEASIKRLNLASNTSGMCGIPGSL